MTPITSYLKDGVLPDNKGAARKLKVQAARFILIKDIVKWWAVLVVLGCFLWH